jgi:hypothetical protein
VSFNARNTDPPTSHEGAEDLSSADRAKVYQAYWKYGPDGLADFELDRLLGGSMNGKWRKRRSDLTREGILIAARNPDGTVKTRRNPASGKQQVVWTMRRDVPSPPEPSTVRPGDPDLPLWQKVASAFPKG